MKMISRRALLPDLGVNARTASVSAVLLALLQGCAYYASLNPAADDRVQLTPSNGEIRLGRREARDLICADNLLLYCRNWGSARLACECVRP